VIADALSRQSHLAAISTFTTQLTSDASLKEMYHEDEYFRNILEALQHSSDVSEKQLSRARNFVLEDGRIYLKRDHCLAIPNNKEIRTRILNEGHDIIIAGHVGMDKTYDNVANRFYWPKMTKDISKYVLSCDSCQQNKSVNRQPAGLLQPLAIPSTQWEQVTMDFVVQLPLTKQGHDAIVVFIDKLTKRAHFQAIHTITTAPEVAKLFFANVFKNHGLP